MISILSKHLRISPLVALVSVGSVFALHACSGGGSGGSSGSGATTTTGTSTTGGGSGGTEGGSGGAGGSGGTQGGSGGSGGVSSTGGSQSTGGTATTAGGSGGDPGTAGAAGEGGMPAATEGEACLACADEGDCSTALADCEAVPACATWADCVATCDDDACVAACDESATGVGHLTAPLYSCLGDRCEDACEAIELGQHTCENSLAPVEVAPETLAETGLYVLGGTGEYELAPYMRSFTPKYELWADGAVKERFIYIPECARIGSADMDNWDFPVGTRIFKAFSREPSGGGDRIAVETRMMHRFGEGADDWLMVTYQWDATDEDSIQDPELALLVDAAGVVDANGTNHNIPSQDACLNCHGKLPATVLGFSAIQLSHDDAGETLAALSSSGRLTEAADVAGYPVPGSVTAAAALGTLHANCGHCHNEYFLGSTLHMQLLVGQTTVDTTSTYLTAVGIPADNGAYTGLDRIEPGNFEDSVIYRRMDVLEMPPGNAANELPNTSGLEALEAWISSLPPE